MKINYYSYSSPFLEKTTNKSKNSIYIFSNYKSKIEAEKKQTNNFLKKNDLFLNLQDFKEKIAPTQNIILREEKLTTIFYKLLNDDEKKALKVNDYFDVIEISSKFYNFFGKMESYYPDKDLDSLKKLIDDRIDLKKWQEQKINIFFAIRKRYYNFMSKNGFTDQNIVFNKENFTDYYFSNYSNIIFVNKFNFNTKEKDLLNFLEKKGYSVELNLQLKKGDFSEEELSLKEITLPEKNQTDLKLFSVKEDVLQLVNSILKLSKTDTEEKNDILECNLESKNYIKFLNEDFIEIDENNSFTESKIYRYLNYLKNIFNSSHRERKFLQVEIGAVLKAVNCDFFRNYYEISKTDKSKLIVLKNKNYIYLTEDLLKNEELTPLLKIFSDIKKLENINSFKKFINFLDNIELKKLNDKFYKNNYEIYYSSIHEIQAINKMKIITNWKNYFNNLANGFLKFFLNYLRYKKIKKHDKENKNINFKISSLESAAEINRDNLSIINASSDILSQKEDNFILSKKQKEKLGLNNSEDKNILEKYHFMRHILSSKKAYIFSMKNLDENISESAYMEELSLKYNLEIVKPEFNTSNFDKVIRQIFSNNNRNIFDFSKREIPYNFKNEKLIMESSDFSDYSSLSYYRFKRIKDCQYRYYLEHIIGLEKNDLEIEKQLGVIVFGSLVHEIFAEIIKNRNMNLELKNKNINKITAEILEKYDLKINNYYEKYYNNVLFEKVKDSVDFFLKEMKRITKNKKLDIYTELSSKEWEEKEEAINKSNIIYESDFSKFYLNGRVDLLLKGENKNIIIDFKTGGSDTTQLDFYDLMLFSGNIENKVEKMIYKVIEEKFDNSYKNKKDFELEIREELDKFMEENEYTRIYKSRCRNCPYYDICRVVVK